jgi:NADH dehydrogenase (ubiquinone) Fe-S protein 6
MVDPDKLPPIQVTTGTARCDGEILKGLGHPTEFIRVGYEKEERCKYCGLRFIRVHGSHGGHH